MLAKSIRSHPRFFLRQVAASDVTCTQFSWILNMSGLEYVDRMAAAAYEIRMREASLKNVKDKALAKVRANCLRLIKQR